MVLQTIETEAAGELKEVFQETALRQTARCVWNEDEKFKG